MSVQAGFALRGRNPDVLTCIANLSNDEVFTPPELANRMLDTLAAAYAEAGRFEDAVRTAQKALELTKSAAQAETARGIEERLRLYQAGRPYRGAMAAAP